MTRITIRIAVVGLVVPLMISIAAAILMVSWLPTLPGVVAVHWGGAEADGFAPVWVPIVLPLAITGIFTAFAVGSSLGQARNGSITRNQKLLLVVGVWLSVVMSATGAGSLAIQRTGTLAEPIRPTEYPDGSAIALILISGVGVGIVLAIIAWLALPKADDARDESAVMEPIAITETERLTWMRTARISSRLLLGISLIFTIAIIAVAIAAVSAQSGSGGLIFAGIVLFAAALMFATTAAWRVTADSRGLIARSWMGWPRVRVRADDIRSVRIVTVGAGGEFGGYGIRWGFGGRMGIILKAGPALEVTRRSGHTVLVTVDDAETGARVLATYQTQDA